MQISDTSTPTRTTPEEKVQPLVRILRNSSVQRSLKQCEVILSARNLLEMKIMSWELLLAPCSAPLNNFQMQS